MAALGLMPSAWGLLAVPGAALVGFGFGGAGLGLTTYMRSWFDFDYIQIALVPLFLFSATFFPIDQYPDAVAWLVRVSPLYQGVGTAAGTRAGRPVAGAAAARRLSGGHGRVRSERGGPPPGPHAPALSVPPASLAARPGGRHRGSERAGGA